MGARGPVEVRVVWVRARGPVEVRVVWVPGAQWRLGLCGCPGPSGG